MSIVRIDSDSTHGWQARAHVGQGRGPLTMLCSDAQHGGKRLAHRAAKAAEELLQLQADALRRRMALEGLDELLDGRR